ncbi:MAG: NIPSNAP family protein [Chloroflexi bacterium]|nr:NIPSNAP family protein [Chloroflexota bacterium]
MIYDMRTYDIAVGQVGKYMEAVEKVGLKVREDHGIKLAGWYYTDIGTLNRAVHIWAYEDYAHYEKARAAFRSDPGWINEYMPMTKGLILKQTSQMMNAAPFSPQP